MLKTRFFDQQLSEEIFERARFSTLGQLGLLSIFCVLPEATANFSLFTAHSMILLFTSLAMRFYAGWKASKDRAAVKRLQSFFTMSVLLSAIGWGSLIGQIYAIYGLHDTNATLGTMILAGVCAASLSSLTPIRHIFYTFLLGAIGIPTVIILCSGPSSIELGVVATFVLYFIFLVIAGTRSHKELKQRLQALQAAQDSHRLTQKILDGIPGPVSLVTRELKYTFVNANFHKELEGAGGADAGLAMAADARESVGAATQFSAAVGAQEAVGHAESWSAFRGRLAWFFAQSALDSFSAEIQLPTVRGPETFLCLFSRIDNGDVVVASANIQNLKNSQATMEASAKLALLGELAGGFAHEINNPLAIISGNVQSLQRKSESGVPVESALVAEACRKVLRGVDRIGKIIRGLRVLSRDETVGGQALTSLEEIISDTLPLVEDKLKSHSVELRMDPLPVLMLHCNAVQISQVILNLVSNACDALAGQAEKWIRLSAAVEPHGLVLRIEDSGPGIPEALREKIFQPFFTTKEVGKGTGLGLSVSHSIVKHHGGSLTLNSKSAHTEFVLRLPCEAGAAAGAVAKNKEAA